MRGGFIRVRRCTHSRPAYFSFQPTSTSRFLSVFETPYSTDIIIGHNYSAGQCIDLSLSSEYFCTYIRQYSPTLVHTYFVARVVQCEHARSSHHTILFVMCFCFIRITFYLRCMVIHTRARTSSVNAYASCSPYDVKCIGQ